MKFDKINTVCHPVQCGGCRNLILIDNEQTCIYACEVDEEGTFHNECKDNTAFNLDIDEPPKYGEKFNIQ